MVIQARPLAKPNRNKQAHHEPDQISSKSIPWSSWMASMCGIPLVRTNSFGKDLAEWAGMLIERRIAHVIVVAQNSSSAARCLETALPSRV